MDKLNKKNVLQSSAGGRGSAVSSGGGLRGALSRGINRVRNFFSGRR